MAGLGLALVIGLACQVRESSDPRSLIEQLGSSRYAEREAAEEALARLGTLAVPSLKMAASSRDLEVRSRAAALLKKIEESVLTQPTLVALDYRDLPLGEVVRSLSERTGMRLVLFPPNQPRWNTDRITLEEPRPLPFWKALDRLCAESRLLPDASQRAPDGREGQAVLLMDRRGRPIFPTCDSGPFRLTLAALEYRRHIGFASDMTEPPMPPAGPRPAQAPPPPRTVATSHFSAQIQLAAEPRLSVTLAGLPLVTEAVDEKGHSLAVPAAGPPQSPVPFNAVRPFARDAASTAFLTTPVPLMRPEEPGKVIKVLRGSIPILAVARQADPLVVPLAGAAGKSFDRGDLHIEIHDIRSGPNDRGRQIDLTARVASGSDAPGADSPATPGSSADLRGPQIEILDAKGQPIPWFRTGMEPEESRLTIGLAGQIAADARELRFYKVSESRVAVPFEFKDLPMP
ncbi:hypothetical protein OJF2_22450 [Aquisphaera giovannonii]|uniref:Uncharacterized protein n=1 Tax=Aquisphaera giovannonii TaxID=406548 RepID=A0A5B9W0G0_9BACT|nr:hypothetical protein [Aquisphaera giovannonii]QEH33739.1 hypothetical protein OJF2_22450 [Aquisphaera giovannonii]